MAENFPPLSGNEITPVKQTVHGSGVESNSSAEAWLHSVSSKIPPEQGVLLRRSQATFFANLIKGPAWAPYSGIMPSPRTYKGVWNWDSAFHAIALSNWDVKLAHEQFKIFFSRQLANGMLPDVIYDDGGTVTTNTKPPVMAWALAVVDHRSPDADFLKAMYPKLSKLGEFFERERGGTKDGLFFYAGDDTGWDSGWDNSIRWDHGYRSSRSDDHRLWAVDLNCYMVSHYEAMAYIAERMNIPTERIAWQTKADGLAGRINERLWDDDIGFYVDRDRRTDKASAALTPAGFMPLFAHIASPGRAARCAKLAVDPNKFFPGMPSAAYDTNGFEANVMWRGPAWLNVSYFALKGLLDYGYVVASEKMRGALLSFVEKDPSTIWEYYEPKIGTGLGAQSFGWSAAFLISLILDWDNNNLTWLFPEIPICGLDQKE